MKKFFSYLSVLVFGCLLVLSGCKSDDEPAPTPPAPPEPSTSELLVKKFSSAPELDGNIDEMWANVQKLENKVSVPDLLPRGTHLNPDGAGVEEDLGLFFPYTGEEYNFTMRAGYFGDRIYFLLEWDDAVDSKDRMSWYFDGTWKQQHKYANAENDKYYEDKFAFLFPIGEDASFTNNTCWATCHQNLTIANEKDKHTRHFLTNENFKVDMWHWKRVRGTYADQVDDQKMVYVPGPYDSGSNGRHGDATGEAGYSDNKKDINGVTVPKYIIPNKTDYYWISIDDINDGTALEVMDVDANGVLTLSDGSTIDPADGGFEEATGNKRIPSVTTKAFTLGRADIDIRAIHTGTGWICEFTRKLNTGDPDDTVFELNKEYPFGIAIFNNAAIAHGILPNLLLKFEQ